jgi:integrating conjugative element protein (TIGR03765 family)
MTSARTLAHALLLTLTGGSTLATAQPATQRWDIRHDESSMLPVSSPSLSPGEVQPRELELPALTRLFLVGDDPRSLAWLAEHAESLRQLGAAGMAVEVADIPALERIRRAGPGLTILPISGDDLGQRLSLRHYPVLIRANRLEQ